MQQVYDLVHRVASLNASVLIVGESGTGKELIAQAIHNLGSRSDRPFVAVSCGAIPETLIESELFGHEKGAFTGTVGSREGYLEQAGDGTLFLDEVGEITLSTQVKLLRVLQQREFSRLGSSRLIPLRARIIFATHQDLGEMVQQGKFRQDLYYRINVMRIDAPSLQEHAEDIPTIALHFLRQYSETYEKPMEYIDQAAMAVLQSYSWPGNVRELENTIQRAIIVASDSCIRVQDLPRNIQEENVVSIADHHPASSFERQIRDFKVKLATAAVRENNGNKTLAARSLNISRAYLHRLIRVAEGGLAGAQDLVDGSTPGRPDAHGDGHGLSTASLVAHLKPVHRAFVFGEGYFRFPSMLTGLLVVLAVLSVRGRFDDPDMWWHLKMGQIIWTTHLFRLRRSVLLHHQPTCLGSPRVALAGAYLWRLSIGRLPRPDALAVLLQCCAADSGL